MKYIYNHLGLRDHIICNGLYRELIVDNEEYIIFTKYHNYDIYHLVKDLPILFINDWSEVTESFLNEKYEEMSKIEWNNNKLKLSYWTNFIKENK